jgi:hypothetical protein
LLRARSVANGASFSASQLPLAALDVPSAPLALDLLVPGGAPLPLDCPSLPASCLLLEAILNPQRQPRLLLRQPDGADIHVNGLPIPRLAVVKARDVVTWPRAGTFYVTVYSHPDVGLPGAGEVGRRLCPVCRVAFQADSRIYRCPCGAAFHCEDEREEGLECATLRRATGCACGRAIALEPGYHYLMEDDND